jgi:predicted amidohydrolase YtcJ
MKTVGKEDMEADLVIRNGRVITVEGDFSIREAVAVKDGRIVHDGSDDAFEG